MGYYQYTTYGIAGNYFYGTNSSDPILAGSATVYSRMASTGGGTTGVQAAAGATTSGGSFSIQGTASLPHNSNRLQSLAAAVQFIQSIKGAAKTQPVSSSLLTAAAAAGAAGAAGARARAKVTQAPLPSFSYQVCRKGSPLKEDDHVVSLLRHPPHPRECFSSPPPTAPSTLLYGGSNILPPFLPLHL